MENTSVRKDDLRAFKLKIRLLASDKIIILLVLIQAISAAITAFLPWGNIRPDNILPDLPLWQLALINGAIVFAIYNVFGIIGNRLSLKFPFREIRKSDFNNIVLHLRPVFWGIAIGIFFIIIDQIVGRMHGKQFLPHPPFPTSLFASLSAAIGEEIIFRLFFVSILYWVFLSISRQRRNAECFFLAAAISAIAFSAGHLPSALYFLHIETIAEIPSHILLEIFLLNSLLSIPAAYMLKNSGLLAAVTLHLSADLVWHVGYGYFY